MFSYVVRKNLRICSAEVVGTFFLTLTIATSRITTSPDVGPFAVSLCLIAIIYALSSVHSHLNPCVSLGLLISNHLTYYEAVYCVTSQFMGAFLAGWVGWALYGYELDKVGYPSVANPDRRMEALVAEVLQSFLVVLVVLHVAKHEATENNSYFGVAIGFAVLSGALVIGNVSGACFNPAVSALTILQGDYQDLWVFLLGPTVGGILASLLFRHTKRMLCYLNLPFKLLYEFIGTFYITWIVALAVNSSTTSGSFAIGCMVTAVTYSGWHISAHCNPCITLGMYLKGTFDPLTASLSLQDCILYVLVQLAGAFCAGGVAVYVQGSSDSIYSPQINTTQHTRFAAVTVEALFTFLLVLTVLRVTSREAFEDNNDYFGLAIGFVASSGAMAVGDISGGAMNPALAVALPCITNKYMNNIWVYLVGEVIGGVLAVFVFYLWLPLDSIANGDRYSVMLSGRTSIHSKGFLSDDKSSKYDTIQYFERNSALLDCADSTDDLQLSTEQDCGSNICQ